MSKFFLLSVLCGILFFQSNLAIAGQKELREDLEQDMAYYKRVVKPTGRNARIYFLNRLIQKYEDKGINSMYLIPVKTELKTLQQSEAEIELEREIKTPVRKYPKRETTLRHYKKAPVKRSWGVIKIGGDTSGKHKVSGEGLSGSEDVEAGLSLSGEYTSIYDKGIELGGGMTYQLPRSQEDYPGDFNFVPIYGLIKICSTTSEPTPYFIGQLGYNVLYEGDDDYTGEASLEGGMYYGIGAGLIFQNGFQIEVLYSVNKGSCKLSGYDYYYGYYDFDFDIDYSKISLSMGYRF